ncbi:MAG: MoxR family ATPase [Acidobacteria bacterium]|nr:MoxR family ATPase [Acidobacteriota bacterium]
MIRQPELTPETVPFPSGEPPLQDLFRSVGAVIRGKDEVVHDAVVTLLAGGHLLIEDIPGVGKTTLARALAQAMGGTFRRVQFTSDLLPADIVGVNVFEPSSREFLFRPGPVFCHVLLADEINRTTPRTQSALLQAMEEQQVTLDGITHALPDPFLVIATQNPLEHHGTYPLPESQMDRFLMRLSMGYPDRTAEKEMIVGRNGKDPLVDLKPVLSPASLTAARRRVEQVRLGDGLLNYLLEIVDGTRRHPKLALGASPRAALALSRAARATALLESREFVLPDDIKGLAEPVLAHRLVPHDAAADPTARRDQVRAILQDVLETTSVPL